MNNRAKSKKRRKAQAENKRRKAQLVKAAAEGELRRQVESATATERARLLSELESAGLAANELKRLADAYLATVNVTMGDYLKAVEGLAESVVAKAAETVQGLSDTLKDAMVETQADIDRVTSPERRKQAADTFMRVAEESSGLLQDNQGLRSEVAALEEENASLKARLTSPDGVLPKFLADAFKKHHNRGFTNEEFEVIVKRTLRWMNDMGVKGGFFSHVEQGPHENGDAAHETTPDPLSELRQELAACTSIKQVQAIAARFNIPNRSRWRSRDREAAEAAVIRAASEGSGKAA